MTLTYALVAQRRSEVLLACTTASYVCVGAVFVSGTTDVGLGMASEAPQRARRRGHYHTHTLGRSYIQQAASNQRKHSCFVSRFLRGRLLYDRSGNEEQRFSSAYRSRGRGLRLARPSRPDGQPRKKTPVVGFKRKEGHQPEVVVAQGRI